jgi:RNA polymerase sigma factor (sigma-70 family)
MMQELAQNLCKRRAPKSLDPDDVVQDAALKIIENIYRYDPAKVNRAHARPVRGLVWTIVVNEYRDDVGKEDRLAQQSDHTVNVAALLDGGTYGDAGQHVAGRWLDDRLDNPQDGLAQQEIIERLMALLRQIHPLLPQVLHQKVDGRTHEQIAHELGISVTTVKRLLKLARENSSLLRQVAE